MVHMGIGESISDRSNSMCKGPEVAACLAWLRNKEPNAAGAVSEVES